jgi:hypothetical protein
MLREARKYYRSLWVLALILTLAAIAIAKPSDIPPLLGITQYGYTVVQENGSFYGTVWAKYANTPDWKMLYSIRKERKDAVKDCENWMNRVEKEFAKLKRQFRKKTQKS